MSKEISAATKGISTSKLRSGGIQVHPVNEKREQNLLDSRSLEPPGFIPKYEVSLHSFFSIIRQEE